MDNLIYELEIALENGAYLMSLNTALIIPDVCAALQSQNGKTNGKKYAAWFNEYLGDEYGPLVTGEDIYKIRCAVLHQGKLNNDNFLNYDRIAFQLPDKNNNVFHRNVSGGFLNLHINVFIRDLIAGYKEWAIATEGDENVKRNYEQAIKMYTNVTMFGFPGLSIIC